MILSVKLSPGDSNAVPKAAEIKSNDSTPLRPDGERELDASMVAEMKTHKAPGIISVQVLEGHISFKTEQKTSDRTVGQMLALQAGIPHSVVAKAESVFLLTLSL